MKPTSRLAVTLLIMVLSSSFALIKNYIAANQLQNEINNIALIKMKLPLNQYPGFDWIYEVSYDDTVVLHARIDYPTDEDSILVSWRIPKGKKILIQITDPFLSSHLVSSFVASGDTLLNQNGLPKLVLKDKLELHPPYSADTLVLAYAERGCFGGEQIAITCIRKGNKYTCTGEYVFCFWKKGMTKEKKFKRPLSLTTQIDSLIRSYTTYVRNQSSPFFCICTSKGQLAIRCRNEYVYLKDIYCCKDNALEAACKKLMEFR